MSKNSMKYSRTYPSEIALMVLLFAVLLTRTHNTPLGSRRNEFRLQIIHNSDVHARFEQVNANYGLCTEEEAKEEKCYGGFARTKTAIEMAKEKANSEEMPTIVLNAGDYFVGTAYYELKKWEITAPMVDALQYDVITLGNHDFDDGIQNLVNFINHVNVPVVCCNLDLTTEPRLAVPNLKPSHILNKNGTKIGVIGFVTPTTMDYSQTENLIIRDEVLCVRAEIEKLKREDVKIFIALSHSGFKEDIRIAKAVPELSLVVGGHTHLLLHTPENEKGTKKEKDGMSDGSNITRTNERYSTEKVLGAYPYRVEVASGKVIPVVHAHAYTKYLGKLIATFDVDGNVKSAHGNTIILDSTIPEDKGTKKFVESLIDPLRPVVKAPIAFTRVSLKSANFSERQFESTLANLVTDAVIDNAVQRAAEDDLKEWVASSIVLLNTGGFLQNKLGYDGHISLEDLSNTFMAGNNLVEATYPGWVIREALEHSVVAQSEKHGFPNFLYISGLRVVYNLSKPIGHRIESIEALCADCNTPRYENLNANQNYKVMLPTFLVEGNQGFLMLRSNIIDRKNRRGLTVVKIVRDYLQKMKIVYPIWDGRITVKNGDSFSVPYQ